MSAKTAIRTTTELSPNLDQIIDAIEMKKPAWLSTRLDMLESVAEKAGVYCFVLPETNLPEERTITLHGPSSGKKDARRQIQHEFKYQANPLRHGDGVVIYVGKASKLRARLKGHLSVNVEATTNQVLRGMAGQLPRKVKKSELEIARITLLQHGEVFYYCHQHPDEAKDHGNSTERGKSYAADRDLLEIKLIAKYAPPFNIKAER